MNKKARVIAFYLPQFHPIPENDEWWGKGFTEWTNVGKAKPLFRGHEQPRVPADLGYYDLRLPIVREQQAELAKEAGVEGFCYWHYWFGNGKTLMSEIFDEVVKSGKPDFPFCLGWANHDWTRKNWNIDGAGFRNEDLIIQKYPGKEDVINHFYAVLPAFRDKRYIKVDGKPLFLVYDPEGLEDANGFIEEWNILARKEGLEGIHFVGIEFNAITSIKKKRRRGDKELLIPASKLFPRVLEKGFDAINSRGMALAHARYHAMWWSMILIYIRKIMYTFFSWQGLVKYDYKKISKLLFVEEEKEENVYPTIIPNWDRSPRSGKLAEIWYNNSPQFFKEQVEMALDLVKHKTDDHKIIFLMSWNEWAEGNYMEPDIKYGKGYIHALYEALTDNK